MHEKEKLIFLCSRFSNFVSIIDKSNVTVKQWIFYQIDLSDEMEHRIGKWLKLLVIHWEKLVFMLKIFEICIHNLINQN